MGRETSTRENIEKRALSAMLTDAFFQWPSAVTIAFSLLMYVFVPNLFSWWQPWFWIVFGVVVELVYLVTTLTDPVASQQAVSRMLMEKFDPNDIKNISARQRLQNALEYKRQIDAFVTKQSGALKVSLSQTADEINSWIEQIYQLARSIDNFEANSIMDRDRRSVPTELQDLKRRLAAEPDPGVKAELQEAIDIRQRLLNDLQTIANEVKRRDIAMDNTLAQLSTVYAQLQLIDTKSLDNGRAQRLQTDIKNEISSLSDIVSAISEVNSYKGVQSDIQKELDAAAQEDAAADSQNMPRQRTSSSRNK